MAKKTAIIAVIPKTYSDRTSMEFALQSHGMSRSPGTGVTLFPHREATGKYRTALDKDNAVIRKVTDPATREALMKKADGLREDLEHRSGIPDLGGTSRFYNYGYQERVNGGLIKAVEPYKLIDGDNIFDLNDHWQAITFYWLSVHPRVASSLEDYNSGKYPSDTQFYVKDEDREAEIIYTKKKTANDAVVKFSSLTPEKKKKVARLCGLPAWDDTREEMVYNMMDTFLKEPEVIHGVYKGRNPLNVFADHIDLDDNTMHIKDLIEQAFANQIYRIRVDKVYEGEQEVYRSKEEMLEQLILPKNQKDVLDLEKKLKNKKLANV